MSICGTAFIFTGNGSKQDPETRHLGRLDVCTSAGDWWQAGGVLVGVHHGAVHRHGPVRALGLVTSPPHLVIRKPISADTLRMRLGIGASQARRCVKIVRAEFQAQVTRDPVSEDTARQAA
jgi:hypothetical protein